MCFKFSRSFVLNLQDLCDVCRTLGDWVLTSGESCRPWMVSVSWLVLHIMRALVFVAIGLLGDFELFIEILEYTLHQMADLLDSLLGPYN